MFGIHYSEIIKKKSSIYSHLRVIGYEKSGQIPCAFDANMKQPIAH